MEVHSVSSAFLSEPEGSWTGYTPLRWDSPPDSAVNASSDVYGKPFQREHPRKLTEHLLRCFGDKGDVEDITEGLFPQLHVWLTCPLLQQRHSTPLGCSQYVLFYAYTMVLKYSYYSGYNLYRRVRSHWQLSSNR